MTSPSLNTRGVHVYTKDKKTNRWYHSDTHPIQWLVTDQGRVAIQDGNVFSASGKMLTGDEIPAWFHAEVAKLSPKLLESLRFKLPKKPN